jgi:hypothetical protein
MSAHYHIWHHWMLRALPPFAAAWIKVPTIAAPKKTRPMLVQSLRNDMDELRALGAKKGIVDATYREVKASGIGRELWALKVGKGSQHKVLVVGGIHAREWLSVEVPFLVAKYLIENYSETPSAGDGGGGNAPALSLETRRRIKHLLDNRQIWFVPMLNPNGHMITMTTNRWWRSNGSAHHLVGKEITAIRHGTGERRTFTYPKDCYRGVDLNRNFPTRDWGEETFDGDRLATSLDPRDGKNDTWAGPSKGSEPETQAMVDLVNEHRFKASISYHSYGKFLVYSDFAAGVAYLQHVGNGMQQVMKAPGAGDSDYEYVCGDTKMYPITGHLADYCLERAPGQPAFTCELPPKDPFPFKLAFNGLPDSEIEPAFREALPGALALINSAGFSTPAGSLKLCADGSTRTVQLVRNCWEVFKDWQG